MATSANGHQQCDVNYEASYVYEMFFSSARRNRKSRGAVDSRWGKENAFSTAREPINSSRSMSRLSMKSKHWEYLFSTMLISHATMLFS
jgi:hypothetical protein